MAEASLFRRLALGDLSAGQASDSLQNFMPLIACQAVDNTQNQLLYDILCSNDLGCLALRYASVDAVALEGVPDSEPVSDDDFERFERLEALVGEGEAQQMRLALRHLVQLCSSAKSGMPQAGLFSKPALLPQLSALLPVALFRCPAALSPGMAVEALLSLESAPGLITTLCCSLPGAWQEIQAVLVQAVGQAATHPRSVSTIMEIAGAVGLEAVLELRDALDGVPLAAHLAMHLTMLSPGSPAPWASSQMYESKQRRKWLAEALGSMPQAPQKLGDVSSAFRQRLWKSQDHSSPLAGLRVAAMLLVHGGRVGPEDILGWLADVAGLDTSVPIAETDLLTSLCLIVLVLRTEGAAPPELVRAATSSLLDITPGSRRPLMLVVWLMLQIQMARWGPLAVAMRTALGTHVSFPENALMALSNASNDSGSINLDKAAEAMAAAAEESQHSAGGAAGAMALECWEGLLSTGRCSATAPAAVLQLVEVADEPVTQALARLGMSVALEPQARSHSVRTLVGEVRAACSQASLDKIGAGERIRGAAKAPLAALFALEVEHQLQHAGGLPDEVEGTMAQQWHTMVLGLPLQEITGKLLAAPVEAYTYVLPRWMALVASLAPHQAAPLHLPLPGQKRRVTLQPSTVDRDILVGALGKAPPAASLAAIEILRCIPTRQSMEGAQGLLEEISGELQKEDAPRALDQAFSAWWASLPPHVSRTLLPALVAALTDSHLEDPQPLDLGLAPAAVLAVDSKVWERPELARVLLGELLKLLEECRTRARLLTLQAARDALSAEELDSALLAQDSAVVQMLLELCLQVEEGPGMQPGPEAATASEVQRIVTEAVNSMFMRQPMLVRLVHSQGYPAELLPLTTATMPLLRACLDFAAEDLLQSPSRDRALFGCQLVGHLAFRHRTPAAFSAARATLIRVQTAATSGDLSFVAAALRPLALAGTAFPELAKDVVLLLQGCVDCGAAVDPHDLVAGAQEAFGVLAGSLLLEDQLAASLPSWQPK